MDLKKEITLSSLLPKGSSFKRTKKPRADKRPSLPKDIVGLKIDSGGLSAAHISNNGDKKLLKYARAPLASGIVSAGEVRDPAALAAALAEFFRSNALPRKGVRLGLGNSRIGVRVTEVAGTEDAQQLENVILHRAHEMISAPLDDAVIDYRVVGAGTDAEGKAIERILLVVAYRDSIEKYLAATDAAGLGVVGIDLEAFALLRATTSPRDKRDPGAAALAAICVDRERTTLAISDGEVCHFTRVLEWGEANIDAAVARGLALAPAEAAEAWRTMSGTESTGTEVGYSQAALHEIVGRELQTLVRELQSTLRFYRSQPNSLLVDMVLLSGALADVPGVTEELHGQLDVHLAVIDPFTRVSIGEGVLRPDRASDLSVAIGLGIED